MVAIPFHFDLIGQEADFDQAAVSNSANWNFPDDALTASIKTLPFNMGFPNVGWARTLVVWWPTAGAQLRFVSFDDGPSNIQTIGPVFVGGSGSGSPVVGAQEVTVALQFLVTARQYKHIGYQVAGNCRVGVARIEGAWTLPT